MRISVQNFWLPKAGSSREEYEDASSHEKTQGELERKKPRFAVADGATESSFSGLWAKLLVDSNSHGPLTLVNLRRRVEILAKRWFDEVSVKPLPWYAERKVRQGAFSTFLGLSLKAGDVDGTAGGQWTALAVGDSCLFQVRGAELITIFPIEHADQFGYHPLLLSSIPGRNRAIWKQANRLEQTGEWLPGDTFLLMTDALAHWFLKEIERGSHPWPMLKEIVGQSQLLMGRFDEWVSEMRTSEAMHNDDMTLLVVTMGESHEATASY